MLIINNWSNIATTMIMIDSLPTLSIEILLSIYNIMIESSHTTFECVPLMIMISSNPICHTLNKGTDVTCVILVRIKGIVA